MRTWSRGFARAGAVGALLLTLGCGSTTAPPPEENDDDTEDPDSTADTNRVPGSTSLLLLDLHVS